MRSNPYFIDSASLVSPSLSLISLCKIELPDGVTTLYFTDNDRDVNTAGQRWSSEHGFAGSSIQLALGISGATQDISLLLNDGDTVMPGITRGMVFNQLINNAKVTVLWADRENLGGGNSTIPIYTGYVTGADTADYGLVVLHTQTVLGQQLPLCYDKYTQQCRHDFGDAGCGVDITTTIDEPTVFDVQSAQQFRCSSDEISPVGYYNNGTCYFVDGINAGLAFEIASFTAGGGGHRQVTLKVPMPNLPTPGDNIQLYGGCDKKVDGGCTYWNNVPRFGGEPFVPTSDLSNIVAPQVDVPQATTPPAAVADTPTAPPVFFGVAGGLTAPNGSIG